MMYSKKKVNSLKGRIQASENIENGKFPEIKTAVVDETGSGR